MASHYYAQLGIGGLARPMVVGDRLWLFSHTSNGPAPVQSLLLPNSPQILHPSLPPPTNRALMSSPQIMVNSRPSFVNRPTMVPVQFNSSRNPMRFQSSYENCFPIKPHLSPCDYSKSMEGPFFTNKYLGHNMVSQPGCSINNPNLPPSSSSGLADLERAFGNRGDFMNERGLDHPAKMRPSTPPDQAKECDSETEIDCEQIDEDD